MFHSQREKVPKRSSLVLFLSRRKYHSPSASSTLSPSFKFECQETMVVGGGGSFIPSVPTPVVRFCVEKVTVIQVFLQIIRRLVYV